MVADVEDSTGRPLVSSAPLEDELRVPGAPRSKRVATLERRPQHFGELATDLRRQVVQLDGVGLGEGNRPFDHPLQLADVAGPLIGAQGLVRRRRQRERPRISVPFEKVVRQLDDVVGPLPQWRHRDLNAGEPVIQIRPKETLLHQPRQRPVRRRYDAGVHAAHAMTADALDGDLLNRPQQLRLCRRREVGHLVEKDRAAIGILELAAPSANAGCGPVFDAEELGLQQRLHDRRTIHRDEWSPMAPTELVHLARDQFLPDAGLAFNQHGEIRQRHPLDATPQLLHRRRRSNQRGRAVLRSRTDDIAAARGFEHKAGELRDGTENLIVAIVQIAVRITGRLEDHLDAGIGIRHTKDEGVRGPRRRHQPHLIACRDLAEPHRAHPQQPLHFALEHHDQVLLQPDLRDGAAERRDDLLHRSSFDSGGRQRIRDRPRYSTNLVAHRHPPLQLPGIRGTLKVDATLGTSLKRQ